MMKNLKPELSEPNRILTARAEQLLLQKLPVDQALLRRTAKLLEPKNLKRIGLLAIGSSVLISIVSSVGHDSIYRAAVAKEMKKQLDPLRKKLDDLEAQNLVLWQQNQELLEKLNGKTAEE